MPKARTRPSFMSQDRKKILCSTARHRKSSAINRTMNATKSKIRRTQRFYTKEVQNKKKQKNTNKNAKCGTGTTKQTQNDFVMDFMVDVCSAVRSTQACRRESAKNYISRVSQYGN